MSLTQAMGMGEFWSQMGSLMASLMFLWALFQQYFPSQLRDSIENFIDKSIISHFSPYIQINFPEFTGHRLKRNEAFTAIQSYLSSKASSLSQTKRLKAEFIKNSKSLLLSMDDYEEVLDHFNGVKIWWYLHKSSPNNTQISLYPSSNEKRYYNLTFHRKHKEIITGSFLEHVLEEGKAVAIRNRQRKLYTNESCDGSWCWSHVPFEHPASFDTLAMDLKKKKEIMNDLLKFSKGKEYYDKIGKAWKRGYLLYGPPGTGKSTMIVAMANFLGYDVYDLELTTVKDNSELKQLLIETSSKSVIVIEDIDCSLDFTAQRNKKKKDGDDDLKEILVKKEKEDQDQESKVTLSGLLNFIDGIWSACGGERIIVFTTNYVEKLDPALIRRGRMDKHIEMSYCCFDAFKILAKNYLDVEFHDSFEKIGGLLEQIDMTPADVAEHLMPMSGCEDADVCFKNLIEALESSKEAAKKKLAENGEEDRGRGEMESGSMATTVKKKKNKKKKNKKKKN